MLHRLVSLLAASSLCLAAPSQTELNTTPSGSFNFLSINLFSISGDAADIRTVMSNSSYNYSIINIQEDTPYRDVLYHNIQSTFNVTDSSEDGGKDSGMDTFSKYYWIDPDYIQLNDGCIPVLHGTCSQRGFTFKRVRFAEGVYMDIINLQTDESLNQAEKNSYIQKVSKYIHDNSIGNAVILSGDTGMLYTDPGDNVKDFTTVNNLTDAWVHATGGKPTNRCRSGILHDINCEVTDKVFFRGSPFINLRSCGFFYDTARFVSSDNSTLTSRHPIRVAFEYTLTPWLRQSDLYGGPHGTWFNDLPSIRRPQILSDITLRGDRRVDAIYLQINHTSDPTTIHGGPGGEPTALSLQGDYVTSIKLCWGKKHRHTRIFYAEASTNQHKKISIGTITDEDDCATPTAPEGFGLIGTYGRSGDELDRVGLIYRYMKED